MTTDEHATKRPKGVGVPPADHLAKPLFVYGNLKPGELGHDLVSKYLSAPPIEADAAGILWETNGMPLLTLREGQGPIRGALLHFTSSEAYEVVGRFEPSAYYEWTSITCPPDGVEANVLVAASGVEPKDDGEGYILGGGWSTASDALFTFGLTEVTRTLRRDSEREFVGLSNSPAYFEGHPEWSRYYRLQSAYMLTCSVLERVTSRVIEGKRPTAAVNALGRRPEFVAAVDRVGLQNLGRSVVPSDKPSEPINLNHSRQFGAWAYQIRNNLMHQGKSAEHEAELVRTALQDLHDSLRIYLLGRVPDIGHAWARLDPDGSIYDWQIKPQLAAPS